MKKKTKIIIFVCVIFILIGIIILSSLWPRAKKAQLASNTNTNTSNPINNDPGGNEENLYVDITYKATSEVFTIDGTDKTITVYQDFPTVKANDETVKNKLQAELGKIASDEFESNKKEVKDRIADTYGIDANYMNSVGNLTLKWTWSNNRNDSKVISVRNELSGGLGGVSWNQKQGYSFSAETGDRLTIKEIAINPDALTKYVNMEIVKYLKSNYQKLGIYPNILDSLSEKINIEKMNWYLSNNGLTVCFDKDDVSPNTFDYTILYRDLKDLVKDEYLK